MKTPEKQSNQNSRKDQPPVERLERNVPVLENALVLSDEQPGPSGGTRPQPVLDSPQPELQPRPQAKDATSSTQMQDEHTKWLEIMNATNPGLTLSELEALAAQQVQALSSIYAGNESGIVMDSMNEDGTWEVEKVLDKKINPITGNVEYLLKWKAWDGDPTWEPEENCACTVLIRKFEKEALKIKTSSSQNATPKTPSKRGRPPTKKSKSSTGTPSSAPYNDDSGHQEPMAIEAPPSQSGTSSPVFTPKNRSLKKNSQTRIASDDTGNGTSSPSLRRSTRVRKPPIEIITLGDSSDTASNQDDFNSNANNMSDGQTESTPAPTVTPNPPSPSLSNSPIDNGPMDADSDSSSSSSSSNSSTRSSVSKTSSKKSPSAEITRSHKAYEEKLNSRKLKLKSIVAAVRNDNEMQLVVQWEGLEELERVPISIMRHFYSKEVLDFLLDHLKWTS